MARTGLAAGGVIFAIDICGYFISQFITGRAPRLSPARARSTARVTSCQLAFDLGGSIFQGLAMLLMLYSMRLLLRRELAAIGAGALILALPSAIEAGIVTGIAPFIVQVLGFAAIARVGIVAGIAASTVLYQFPVTIPPDGWHAGVGMLGLVH